MLMGYLSISLISASSGGERCVATDKLSAAEAQVERLREALEKCHDLFWDIHCRAGVDIVHKALAAPQDGGNDER